MWFRIYIAFVPRHSTTVGEAPGRCVGPYSDDRACFCACSSPRCKPPHPHASHPSPRAPPTQRRRRKFALVEFLGMSPHKDLEVATAKLMSVLPGSLHAASTQCVLHEGDDANKRRYAGVGGKFLFVSCVGRFFPTWRLESVWGP